MRTPIMSSRAARAAAVGAALLFSAAAGRSPGAQSPTPARALRAGAEQFEVAHDRSGAADAATTVLAVYPTADGDLPDHAAYLAALDARFADRGLAVAVVLPASDAAAFAERHPGLAVAVTDRDAKPQPPRVLVTRADGHVEAQLSDIDALGDVMEALASGDFDAEESAKTERGIEHLLRVVTDGDARERDVAETSARAPRSGRARAAVVLHAWWCRGEPKTARAAAERGLRALAGEGVPMVRFADLVLRGDRHDPVVAEKIADAMAPFAAAAPRGRRTQLVYLRSLLRAGRDRDAGRIAATLPRRLAGAPALQVVFAETLMEAAQPLVHRDAAARALQRAEAGGADRRWIYAARHKLLARCGDDAAAAALAKDYRAKSVSSNSLNNDAWYLMTQVETLGRFDTLALAQCEEMQQEEGDALDFVSADTVALAMFCSGRIARAIELQAGAVKAIPNDLAYEGRLLRYRATAKLLARDR